MGWMLLLEGNCMRWRLDDSRLGLGHQQSDGEASRVEIVYNLCIFITHIFGLLPHI